MDIQSCKNGGNINNDVSPFLNDFKFLVSIYIFYYNVYNRIYKSLRTLLIHGMQDDVVNCSYAVRAREAYGEEQCKLMLIRDAGHGFTMQQNESVMTAIKHFLKKEVDTNPSSKQTANF